MERLSLEQSNLLKQIYHSPMHYSNLSDSEKIICQFLIELDYVNAEKIHKSSSCNGVSQFWIELDTVSISESGKMYLINEKLSIDESLYLQEQLRSLNDLVKAAKSQAETAKIDSLSAKKDALFSKIVSIIAIIISILAIVVPILA